MRIAAPVRISHAAAPAARQVNKYLSGFVFWRIQAPQLFYMTTISDVVSVERGTISIWICQ